MKKEDYLSALKLEPHREGGWFRQIYVSEDQMFDSKSDDQRYCYTSIYFLLDKSNCSHFHRLNHDELWYYHDGAGIKIHCIAPSGEYKQIKLGKNVLNGEVLQYRVPSGTIFASEVSEDDSFGLVSCVVAPGFDYRDFELMKKKDMLEVYPDLAKIIDRLTFE